MQLMCWGRGKSRAEQSKASEKNLPKVKTMQKELRREKQIYIEYKAAERKNEQSLISMQKRKEQ